jgi:site-specific DNA-methyltransferase (adenine-specific)/site-specific DNA-methyltransferase (cytosine-N4-specific)
MRHPKAGTLICGDALSLIPTLANRSVNLCLTSPPYAMQRKRQYGGVAEKEYPAWMAAVMAALRPKLTNDGSVLLVIRSHVCDGVVSDYVLRTRLALRNEGWMEFQECVWLKRDAPFLGSHDRLRASFEPILCFAKSKVPYINLTANGNYSDRIGFTGAVRFGDNGHFHSKGSEHKTGQSRGTDVFTANVADNGNGIMHPAAYPVSLCEQLILQFSRQGALVLDPFCGSGTTLVAAQRLGRRWIGFDSKREYVELAAKRLKTTFTEHTSVITPGQPVRLRTDFPDTAKSRRIYLKSRKLNASDSTVFELILSKTVNADGQTAAAELSHNDIAAATKLSRRTVIRSIERLEKAGFIGTVKHEEWHRGNANRIAIASSLLVALEVGASATPGGNGRSRGTRLPLRV